jgi:aldehyde:ferredoxin oxidoreductase
MAETYGYTGKILRVNLTTGDISEFSSDKYLPKYLGSKGLIARLYWDEIGPDVKPFDPENKLIFANGPLNGTGAIGSAKGSVGGKSPVWYPVSSFSYANTATWFPNELKRAGYDAVIIEGKAASPVYLWIDNGKVEIREGRDLWGKTTRNTRALLWKKLGEDVKVACIGPAGENLVVQAVITAASNAVYGRGGFGAVMGSKNLKAIAVRGTGRIKVADARKLMDVNLDRNYGKWLAPGVKRVVNGKEVVGPEVNEIDHSSPAGNIRVDTQLKQWARLGTAAIGIGGCEACNNYCRMKRTFYSGVNLPTSSYTCASGIGWTGVITYERNKRNGTSEMMDGYECIEYNNLVDDLGLNANNMSNVASYMGYFGKLGTPGEAEENTTMGGDWLYQGYLWGIFTEENTGLPWSRIGTSEFSQTLLRKIAYREGFGDVIAQGYRYATRYVMEHEEFGPNRADILTIYMRIESKAGNMGGIENGHGNYTPNSGRSLDIAVRDRTGSEPEYMFSGMHGYFGFASWPTDLLHKWWGEGAEKAFDHHNWDPEVAHTVIVHEQNTNVIDSLHVCSFVNSNLPVTYRDIGDAMTRTPEGGAEYLSAIFGREVTFEELRETADRISNLTRAIFVRDGYTTIDDGFWGNDVDTHWEYTFQRKDADGVDLVNKEGFLRLRASYYEERGWVNGVPTRATLEKYDLKDVADDLDARGLLPA